MNWIQKAWQIAFLIFIIGNNTLLQYLKKTHHGRKPDGNADNNFYVAYNMHWEPHEFDLPNLPKKEQWHVVFHTDKGEINGIYPEGKEPAAEGKRFLVPPRSIVVFIGKK